MSQQKQSQSESKSQQPAEQQSAEQKTVPSESVSDFATERVFFHDSAHNLKKIKK